RKLRSASHAEETAAGASIPLRKTSCPRRTGMRWLTTSFHSGTGRPLSPSRGLSASAIRRRKAFEPTSIAAKLAISSLLLPRSRLAVPPPATDGDRGPPRAASFPQGSFSLHPCVFFL